MRELSEQASAGEFDTLGNAKKILGEARATARICAAENSAEVCARAMSMSSRPEQQKMSDEQVERSLAEWLGRIASATRQSSVKLMGILGPKGGPTKGYVFD